jgi:hypothetical protein
MRMRVPRQASTKWWFLLAALLATLITWWQVERESTRGPDVAPPAATEPADGEIEIEVEIAE